MIRCLSISFFFPPLKSFELVRRVSPDVSMSFYPAFHFAFTVALLFPRIAHLTLTLLSLCFHSAFTLPSLYFDCALTVLSL